MICVVPFARSLVLAAVSLVFQSNRWRNRIHFKTASQGSANGAGQNQSIDQIHQIYNVCVCVVECHAVNAVVVFFCPSSYCLAYQTLQESVCTCFFFMANSKRNRCPICRKSNTYRKHFPSGWVTAGSLIETNDERQVLKTSADEFKFTLLSHLTLAHSPVEHDTPKGFCSPNASLSLSLSLSVTHFALRFQAFFFVWWFCATNAYFDWIRRYRLILTQTSIAWAPSPRHAHSLHWLLLLFWCMFIFEHC